MDSLLVSIRALYDANEHCIVHTQEHGIEYWTEKKYVRIISIVSIPELKLKLFASMCIYLGKYRLDT